MFAAFFVDRPVFSTVLSVVIVIIGGVALMALPIAQYPEVTPPTVSITTTYPGASAKVVSETVAAPIEQEVNGVEKMLYMSSRATNDGQCTIDVTFEVGTDIDFAQVLTQNRVSIALPKLPETVRQQGVTVKKKSPSILLCVNLLSPDGRFDQLYLSNYATSRVKDKLARLAGVGDVTILGARDYSMRIWLDPDRLAIRNLTASDVMRALKEQNVQVAAGRLGQQPAPKGEDFELILNTRGRLLEAEEFANVIVKTGEDGQIVRISDIARTELGARNYDMASFLDGKPCVTMAVFQLPGSNALSTADGVRKLMDELKTKFDPGLEYDIVYDTTVFIEESVNEVYKTLFEAFILVFIVVLVFLQDWRATLMPMIDVPVSLIGTFAVMAMLGFSLNNLSLFGLVLAIGIVVDDAIVVVENIERWMHKGLPVREATIRAMQEITGTVIAITLVLSSVFIPTAFIAGISGEFYRQFALTIATSTIISAINAMTMAPARAAQIFKPRGDGTEGHHEALPWWGNAGIGGWLAWIFLREPLAHLFGITIPGAGGHGGAPAEHGLAAEAPYWILCAALVLAGAALGWVLHRTINRLLGIFFKGFNWLFERAASFYGRTVGGILRITVVMLIAYCGLLYLTWVGFMTVPTGFIPQQDKGYLALHCQLPDGASFERSQEAITKIDAIVRETPGVAHTIALPGYNLVNSVNLSNTAGMFIILDPFHDRAGVRQLSGNAIAMNLRKRLSSIIEAQVAIFGAPPVDGLGSTGGFKLYVQDASSEGPIALQQAVDSLARAGNAQPGLVGLFSSYRASQPQLYLNIDDAKAKSLGVAISDINDTLQVYLGSGYANDFTRFDRNWQVNVQADAAYRVRPEDVGHLKVRNIKGDMIPLSTLIAVEDTTGPAVVYRYQMLPAAEINGSYRPGTSSGQGIAIMDQLAEQTLPVTMSTEWTELTLLQILAGNTAGFVFVLGSVLVYLVLSAQYESWSLSLAVILIVPMCLVSAIAGVWVCRMDNNIFTQIGLVVLIGMAAKNAILIVQFARQGQEAGMERRAAIIEACRTRLRPILMTSFAFILGVVPLVIGVGAGAEMRNALGVAVFSGMLGVTVFGLLFTPVFYDVIMRWKQPPVPVQSNPAP